MSDINETPATSPTVTHREAETGTVVPKDAPGASWRNNEQHNIPKNNLILVFSGLMLAIFLAAIDQTIIATALPVITSQLGGGRNYSWVGSAYLLAAASLSPLYAKLSDLVGNLPIFSIAGQNLTLSRPGRKPILYAAISIFLVNFLQIDRTLHLTSRIHRLAVRCVERTFLDPHSEQG